MTTPRDAVADDRVSRGRPADRSVVPSVRGIRWWFCVLVALVPTAVGVTIDVVDLGTLGTAFLIAYPLGCLLATAAARRDELFVPMVQPPLIVAVTVPVVVAATGSLPSSGGLASVLAVAGPLINGFPAMAITTTACLALGGARIALQPAAEPIPPAERRTGRPDPSRHERAGARGRSQDPDRDRDRPRSTRRASTEAFGPSSSRTPSRSVPPSGPPPPGTAGPVVPPPPGAGPPVVPPPPAPAPAASSTPTEPAPRTPLPGSDEEPARRSPLVLPPEGDEEARPRRPLGPAKRDEERRRRVREERMRVDRMREERRREERRRTGPVHDEQLRDEDRREERGNWGPRRRPER